MSDQQPIAERDVLTEFDVKMVHPDYPTPIPAVNEMYRDHARRCRDHFARVTSPDGGR